MFSPELRSQVGAKSALPNGRTRESKASSRDATESPHRLTPTAQPRGQDHRLPTHATKHRLPHFSQPHRIGHGRPPPLLPTILQGARLIGMRRPDRRALGRSLGRKLRSKNSMIHGILQFTLSIAFRYVLHRNKSRDIRCRESFPCVTKISHPHEKWLKANPTYNASQQAPFPLKTTALHNTHSPKGRGSNKPRRAAFQTTCPFQKG